MIDSTTPRAGCRGLAARDRHRPATAHRRRGAARSSSCTAWVQKLDLSATPPPPPPPPPPQGAPVASRAVPTVEGAGVELHVVEHGRGPAVLLVHGLAADGEAMALAAE